MKRIHLLLPYSLPPQEVAKDLQAQLKAPHFATLLGLTRAKSSWQQSDYARAHIHEYFLSGDLTSNTPADRAEISESRPSPALAHTLMAQYGLAPQDGYWFLLQPVHLHVALDHLVLTDSQELQLTSTEAQAFFAMAETLCLEYGHALLQGDDKHWFLRADQWSGLNTASLNAACGHNIEIWMAEGEHARAWRKLQNEIQMEWFNSDLHQAREAAGKPSLNSLWLSHGADRINCQALNVQELSSNAASFDFAISQTETLYICRQLELAWLNQDWYQWLLKFAELDQRVFAVLTQALANGQLQQLDLSLSRANQMTQCQIKPKRWWQFGRQATLTLLSQDLA